MPRAILAAILAVSVSCSAADAKRDTIVSTASPIEVCLDSDLGPSGVGAAISAIQRWAEKTGVCFRVVIRDTAGDAYTWDTDARITVYSADFGWKKIAFNYLRGGNDFIGLMVHRTKDIFVMDSGWKNRLLVMHEVGHALGLDHSKNRASVMYPKLHNDPMDITKADAIAAARMNSAHICR